MIFELELIRIGSVVVAALPSELALSVVKGESAESAEQVEGLRAQFADKIERLSVEFTPYTRGQKVAATRAAEVITDSGLVQFDHLVYQSHIVAASLGRKIEEVDAMSPVEFAAIYREIVLRCEPTVEQLRFFSSGPTS